VNFLKSFGLMVAALILQQTVIRIISIGDIRPDLLIIALVAVSLRFGCVIGLYCGFLIGIVQDVYAVETLGANVLAKSIVGYGIGLLDEKVLKIMPATKVFFLAGAFFLHDILYYMAAGYKLTYMAYLFTHVTFPSAIYTLLVGALVFYFFVVPAKNEV
jgi:rod shape-determining protein MreD